MGNPMGQTRLDQVRTMRAEDIARAKQRGLSDKEINDRLQSEVDTGTAASFGVSDTGMKAYEKGKANTTSANEYDENGNFIRYDDSGKPTSSNPTPPVAPDMADELLMKGAAGDVIRLRRGSRRNSFLGGAGDVRAPLGNTTLLGRGY